MPSVWDSSHSAWQATAGATWGASKWRGAKGATVTRERAISVAEVTQPGFTGLSFHTSRHLDEPVCPPLIIFMLMCTILFFMLLACVTFYLLWWWSKQRKRHQNDCETLVISNAIQLLLMEPRLLNDAMTNLNQCRLPCLRRHGFHLME